MTTVTSWKMFKKLFQVSIWET